jgi:hypothetical protein
MCSLVGDGEKSLAYHASDARTNASINLYLVRRILAMLECNIFLTSRSFGDKIQRHSDPTSKSLLGILRDLRIIVDVLANINQSSRRSRVEVFA